MFTKSPSKTTTLVIVVGLLTLFSSRSTIAWQIRTRQYSGDNIRLGIVEDEDESSHKRGILITSDDANEYDPEHPLLPQKIRNVVKRTADNRRFRLCGQQLHQMLAMVCNSGRGKRSAEETEKVADDYYTSISRPYEKLGNIGYWPIRYNTGWHDNHSPLEKYYGTSFQEFHKRSSRQKRSRSNGASQCCRQSCSLAQLRRYCPSS